MASLLATAACGGAPSGGTASPAPSSPASRSPVVEHQVASDLDCGQVGILTEWTRTADVNGDGEPDRVVARRCDAAAGAPPSNVALYLGSPSGSRLAGLLVRASDDVMAQGATVVYHEVIVTALGWTAQAPRCCPDRWEHFVTKVADDGALTRTRVLSGPVPR